MKEELPILRATYDHKLRQLQQRIAAAAGSRGRGPAVEKPPAQPEAAAGTPPRIPAKILSRLFRIINDRI